MRNFVMWSAIIAMLMLMLYDLKYNVRTQQRETARLEAELMDERRRVHMLELEWTRISRPERIAELAKKHLKLQPIGRAQLMQDMPEQLGVRPANYQAGQP